jgi:hypothetical protein
LALGGQIPVQKHKKYEKQGSVTPPKLSTSTEVNNNNGVYEFSKKIF